MKKLGRIIPILFLGVTSGCSSPVPFLMKQYEVGKSVEASVGNPIVLWAIGVRKPDPASRQQVYKSGYNEPILKETKIVFRSIEDVNRPTGYLKELIYKGVVEEKMQCVYREFDMAEFTWLGSLVFPKPAFFLDVTYDLKQSKIIGYADFKIRIESADGQRVIYTVLEEPKAMDEAALRQRMKAN